MESVRFVGPIDPATNRGRFGSRVGLEPQVYEINGAPPRH